MDRAELGRRGENETAALLRERGFSIVARNVRVGRLEIDLIATRGRLLVICEVRTRRTDAYGSPAETITHAKAQRVRRAGYAWARENARGMKLRFDAAAVIIPRRGDVRIDYYEDAF